MPRITRSSGVPHQVHRAVLAATTSLALVTTACSSDALVAPGARAVQASLAVANATGPQACHPDSKLIGRVSLTTDDVPGTWWYITREGFDAAGVTDYLGFIEFLFGQNFASLDEAVTYLVSLIVPLDENGNGFVCAYELRGTIASVDLPGYTNYAFAVHDDKHVNK